MEEFSTLNTDGNFSVSNNTTIVSTYEDGGPNFYEQADSYWIFNVSSVL